MSISFRCPGCGKEHRTGNDFAGKQVRCDCGTVVRVPAATVETPDRDQDRGKGKSLLFLQGEILSERQCLVLVNAIALTIFGLVWFVPADHWLRPALFVVLVFTLPIVFLTLIGHPPVMTLSPFIRSSRERARRREMHNRPELTDREFYQRFYAHLGIPEEVPLRLRDVYALQLSVTKGKVLPQDRATEFDEELDFGELLFSVADEFGVEFSEEETERLVADGTFDAVVRHLAGHKPVGRRRRLRQLTSMICPQLTFPLTRTKKWTLFLTLFWVFMGGVRLYQSYQHSKWKPERDSKMRADPQFYVRGMTVAEVNRVLGPGTRLGGSVNNMMWSSAGIDPEVVARTGRSWVLIATVQKGKVVGASTRSSMDVLDVGSLEKIARQSQDKQAQQQALDVLSAREAVEKLLANQKQRAIAKIQKLGGTFEVDETRPRKPVVSVALGSATDANLRNLGSFIELRELRLDGALLNGSGLAHLKELHHLRELSVAGCPITDAGLAHLNGLTKLRQLNLSGTPITDEGLVHLRGLTRLETLALGGTPITDAGLENLKGLTKLRHLSLPGKQVSDEGLTKLQQALPNCKIVAR
ncbi:MAG: hypothetical protein H8E44_08395 [Planctomycetes bacterium]|nr:hypothetical protein [Planctomycetota bacterium]MBL7041516.1 hypothetical protein [Pirellulaceae bacterium]